MQGQDNPPYYRRIGDIRALFIKDEVRMEILVFDIDSRDNIYLFQINTKIFKDALI